MTLFIHIFTHLFGNCRYLQSLLDCKKKEANEFRIKIEDLSTQLLVQEETKTNIAEQLQRCQYEVSSLKVIIFFHDICRHKSNFEHWFLFLGSSMFSTNGIKIRLCT